MVYCVKNKCEVQDMARNEKELEEISTTDKLKAFKALKEAGYRVEMNGSGVPTVVCVNTEDIDKSIKSVKKIFKDMRYIGSFGVRGPRKTDMMGTDSEENTQESVEPMTA